MLWHIYVYGNIGIDWAPHYLQFSLHYEDKEVYCGKRVDVRVYSLLQEITVNVRQHMIVSTYDEYMNVLTCEYIKIWI